MEQFIDINKNAFCIKLFILLFVTMFATAIVAFTSDEGKKIEKEYGSWICSGTYNVKLNLDLNRNMKFTFNSNNESDEIYVEGNFSFENINKNDNNGYTYYRYTLYPYKLIRNQLLENDYNVTQYEIGVSSDNKNAIIYSTDYKYRFSCRRNN